MDNEARLEKPYMLREFKADDLFLMASIINQIGWKEFKTVLKDEEIREKIANARKKKAEAKETESDDKQMDSVLADVGLPIFIDIAGIILANMEKCKDSLYQLLSNLSGMSRKEIADMKMSVFMDMIVDVIKKDDFNDFFKAASRLFD